MMMEVVVTTGAKRRAKLRSNRHPAATSQHPVTCDDALMTSNVNKIEQMADPGRTAWRCRRYRRPCYE